jgi:hypothetical protein
MRRPSLTLALVVAVAGTGSACTRGCGAVENAAPRIVRPSELTEAERNYGLAPTPHPSVTYQPGVVIVGGGAESIRSMNPNGVEWTIDGSARGAEELAAGRIMFVTGRAVGRVLAVRKVGKDLTVILGPVDITEVIRDGSFSLEEEIDFDQAIEYPAVEYPGAEAPSGSASFHGPGVGSYERADMRGGDAPEVVPAALEGSVVRLAAARREDLPNYFQITPSVGASGIGLLLASRQSGEHARVRAETRVNLKKPKVRFDLKIVGAKITKALIAIEGAAGLVLGFEAATQGGRSSNIRSRIQMPSDFSIPIAGLGVPFAVILRQEAILNTAFGAPGALKARGEYIFTGRFSVGYENQQWGVGGPTGFSVKDSLLQSVRGASKAATGLTLAHSARIMVGIGAFGFATGPYTGMISSIGVTRFSDLTAPCNRTDLNVSVMAGIGYFIPRPVTDAINFFLRALNLGRIESSGGLSTDPLKIINDTSFNPQAKYCTG